MASTIWLIVITALFVGAWITVPVVGRRIDKLRDKQDQYSLRVTTWPKWVSLGVAGLLTVFFLFTLVSSLTYRLDPGESGVIKSWTGEVNDQSVYSENGGIHLKAPWETVTTFNVRNQQIVFQPVGGHDINITASTKDNASVFLDVTLTYNQAPTSVVDIYKRFHTEAEMRTQLIRDSRGALQLGPTQFFTMDIKQKRPELTSAFKNDLEAALEKKYSVEITDVQIRNMWFTDEVQKNLDAVQSRNAEVEQAKATLESTRIKAEITKTDAKAQADADQIQRCGATTSEVIATDPVTGKETKTMQVTPVPMDQCQNRLNEQVLTNKYIEALKEIANKQGNVIITDGKTVPIVSLPQPK